MIFCGIILIIIISIILISFELKQVTKGDDPYFAGLKTHEAKSIDITSEMRKAILEEGVNVMYKGGIVNKVKSMDKPIQGNRREM